MADKLSIRDSQEKKAALLGGDSVTVKELALDFGDASWNISDQKNVKSEAVDKETAPSLSPMPNFGDEDDEPKSTTGSGIDIARLGYGIWGRRNLVTLIALVITTLFVVMAFLTLHHSWKAQAVLIKRDHGDLFTVGQFGQPYKPQEFGMKTLLSTVMLPSVMREAIRRSKVDISLESFAKLVTVQVAEKESNVFIVSLKWENADGASKIANNLAEVFLESNRKVKRNDAEQVVNHYQSQLDFATKSLNKFEAEMLEFKRSSGIVNIDLQTQAVITKMADIEEKLQNEQAFLHVMDESRIRLEKNIKATPEMTVQSQNYPQELKKKLSELEVELEQDSGRYTEFNPKIIDLNKKISNIKAMVEQGKDNSMSKTYTANPIRQELSLRLYRLLDDIKISEGKVVSQKELVNGEIKELGTLSENSKRYFHLVSQLESARRLQDNLLNRVEEAKVMMLKKEGDFDILERAVTPEKPESSGRVILMIAGAIIGVLSGLVTALVLELLDPSIRTKKEVFAITGSEFIFEFQHVPDTEQDTVDTNFPGEPVAVLFRRIINDMSVKLTDDRWQSVGLISAEKGAGKSMILCNLALALALKEESVLIVDADLSANAGVRPEQYFLMDGVKPGLLQHLEGKVMRPSQIARPTDSTSVFLISASDQYPLPKDSIMRLGNKRMGMLVTELTDYSGFVLYDLPSLSDHETSFEALANIGQAILVIRSGQSKKSEVRRVFERLNNAGVNLNSVILTDVPLRFMKMPEQFTNSAYSNGMLMTGNDQYGPAG